MLGGCGAGPEVEDQACAARAPGLELGGGTTAFDLLEPGATIELVHGPQGGYHLELGLRATGLDSSDLAAATLEGTVDGSVMAVSSPWLQFRCNPATGTYDAWPTNLIYDTEDPASLDNVNTDITAVLVDAAGVEFSASLTLTIDDPAY